MPFSVIVSHMFDSNCRTSYYDWLNNGLMCDISCDSEQDTEE